MSETSSTGATSASDLDHHGLVWVLGATADDLSAGTVIDYRPFQYAFPNRVSALRALGDAVRSAALPGADPVRPQPGGSG